MILLTLSLLGCQKASDDSSEPQLDTQSAALDSQLDSEASPGGDSSGGGLGDTQSGETGSAPIDTADLKLYGDWPSEALPLPKLTAYNRDETQRTQEDLVGHPTVIWFYPNAFGPG